MRTSSGIRIWAGLVLSFALGLVIWHLSSTGAAESRVAAPPMESAALEEVSERVLPGDRELLPDERIDINRASAEELQLLPGIGESLSAAIVRYREEHCAFLSPEQLMEVPGIGEKRFEAIKDLICTG